MSEDMPTLYVPDLYSKRWPAERLKLYIAVHDFLEVDKGDDKCLHTTLQMGWEYLGKGNAEKMPIKAPVPQVDLKDYKVRSSVFEDYAIVNDKLVNTFEKMEKKDVGVAKKVHDSKVSVETARDGYKNKLIPYLNTQAATPPPDLDENRHVMTYVTEGCEKSLQITNTTKSEQEDIAKDIKGDSDETEKMTKDLSDRVKALETAAANPTGYPPNVDTSNYPTTGNNDQTTPPAVDDSGFPTGLDSLDDPSSGTTPTNLDGTGTDGTGLNNQTPNGIDPTGTTPGVTTPETPSVPSPAATSPASSGLDAMSMLPLMMGALGNRFGADTDLNSRRAELDPRRYDDELDSVYPQQVASPTVAQPAAVQPAATAPTTQHTGAPTGTTTSTQPAVAPGRTPGADGSVVYTFPDGRTQKVSAMRAQVLDAAFGNKSGTDAQKAYEKTSSKWSDKKQIGAPIDPFQAMTGDVGIWEKRTAVLVVFPSDTGGTMEVIVDGELKPCNPAEMSDKAGEFGAFQGFVHPKDTDVTAPVDGGAPSATPGTADQSANAAMPVVAVPAG
ncbi:hypothetical protein [Nocardia sp. NPDC059691]|uniref:hypothetical protein n=1 Tax=Nocardia sp. NPDC059691 TaxID=3346908 RepID=UPI003687321F